MPLGGLNGRVFHAKLDEMIKTNADARDALIGLEKYSESGIERLRCEEEQAVMCPPTAKAI